MKSDKLIALLSSIHPISPALRQAIEGELIPMSYPKNHMLLEAPKIADHAYFIEEGHAISFSWQDGKRIVEDVWKPGQIMVCFNSFSEQIPSQESLQLLTPCQLLCLSYAGMQRLLRDYPDAHFIYRGVVQRHYHRCRERVQMLTPRDTMVRLRKLRETYPNIEQIMSQDYIASYIGVTPQSLSRAKKNSKS